MKVALFTQDMSSGTFGAAFSGLANALAANGVSAFELLTVRGDMAAAEHPFPAGARHVRLRAAARRARSGRCAAICSPPVPTF